MFLSKSPYGIYYLYYKNEFGRTHKVSTRARLKSDALKFLMSFNIDRERRTSPKLFSQFYSEFIEFSKNNLREGTVELYGITKKFFLEIIGDVTLESLTPFHWDKYKSLRLTKVSPVTVNIELRNLRSLLNKALRWNCISKNPFSLQALCYVPEKFPEYFTKEEFSSFYNTIKEDWFKDLILFGVLTGMRRSEIINLQWKNIDLEKKTIQIVSSPSFRTKAGKKRIIPIHNKLIPMLQQKFNADSEFYVFTYIDRKISGNFITHKFKDIVTLSGVKKKGLHIHSLRHTFASWLVQDGVPLYEVQKLLGHSTITVTEIYAHLQPFQLHNTVNKIHIDYPIQHS